MDYLNAFLCGGILCAIGQILIDKTPLTPARILTGYVVCGVLLTAIGVYEPIVKWGGAGATVPLLGFGRRCPAFWVMQFAGRSCVPARVPKRPAASAPRRAASPQRSSLLC